MKATGFLARIADPAARSEGRAARTAVVCLVALLTAASIASAQQAQRAPGQRITPNFTDTDITQIIDAVSQVTGRTFIVDPRVRANVTMLSSTPMSPEAFYEAFLSILQVHGYIAVPSGDVIKIVPDANARVMPANDLPDRISGPSDEIVTQVVPIKNVSAAQLVPVLRPLIPQYGHLAAYAASNILIISDRAANVDRILRIIRRIDQAGDSEIEVVTLQNASAVEVARVINSLFQQQQAAEGGGANPLKLVADDRSNSLLIGGDQSVRLRVKALIAHLDTPLETGGDTQVRYLRFADAEKIATKLREQVTGMTQAAQGGSGGGGQGATPAAQAERSTTIWADPETNALVITAPPKIMRSLMSIVDKLDIRRAQVLIEAIIVEVQEDKSAELGVNWAAWSEDDDTRIPFGGFLNPVGGVNLINLAAAIDNPAGGIPEGLSSGTTIGIGRIANTGVNFAAMLRALRGDSSTNVIATPSAVTMDNQEAELKVAQEVPFITGQFTNTGTGGDLNPFQTIQREEVGTILKVTPQISAYEGDTVLLKIELESSSIAETAVQAADLITNTRSISTNVLIEDGGIVVLGGLISDQSMRSEQRVPFLGRIPLLGLAFKSRSGRSQKTNLMVFIRPKILRDGLQAAVETNAKYNYMIDQQRRSQKRELLPILPGVTQPQLPPAPPLPEPKPEKQAPVTPEEKEQEAARPAPSGEPEGARPPAQEQGNPR